MKTYKNKILTALLAILLATSLSFVMLSNSTETTVNAAIPTNMLQYEWPLPAFDPQGTCFSDGPGPDAANIKWKVQIAGVSGQPVAFNGFVFVQAGGATYALDGGTGDVVWKASGVSGAMGKIDDTYMAIGSRCVLIADGTTVWTGPPGFSMDQSARNGAGYVAELKMFIDYNYGWSLPNPAQPPTLAWNRTLDYDVGHGYIAAYGAEKIFVGSEDGFMRGIDAKTGVTLWESPTTSTSQIYGGVYIDGKIIHGGLDNNMHAWDAETGERLWTYNPGTYYGQWASDAGAAYGMIYEHNQDTYLYAIDAETGNMVWRTKGPGIGYSGCLVIADGKVYSPMGEYQYRDFYTGEYAYPEYSCFDAYTGELLWTLPVETGAGPSAHECIAYGNLYIIPTKGSPAIPGYWEYGGGGTLDELWCISSEVPDWSMFMSDPEHSAEGAGPTNLALKWKFPTGAQIVSQPTLVDDVCYFGSLDSKIYAIDAETGTQKWTFTTGYQVKSSVAVVDGKVFTGADDGNIYCLNADTGTKIWETYAGGVTKNLLGSGTYLNIAPPVRSSPMVVGSRVYVGSLDGNLYYLDTNNGNVIWKFQTEGPILATPTIVDNKIYFPSCTGGYPIPLQTPSPNGDFYCLDANSGSVIWHKEIPYVLNRTIFHGNHLHASPTVANGMVFVSNGFYYNYAFNATTGETIWIHIQRFNPGTGSQIGGVIQMNAPLYKYGKLYMNDFYGTTCLNSTDGTELWYTWLSRENLMQGITYSYGRVYTVNEVGVLYVLDAITGEKLSYYEFGGYQMHGSPTPYHGNLYIGCNDWNLYCFGEDRLMQGEPAPSAAISSQQIMPELTEPTQAVEAPLITTETAIIAAVAVTCVICLVSYWAIRRRK
jgi:outer membrane protein assembly factor BamB